MAQKKTIQFKGIQRALPQSNMPDGACQEIINARFRKGCWRPMGDKLQHKSFSVSDYTAIWLHDIENGVLNGEPNYIGYKKDIGMLFSIHPTTGAATEIVRDETPGVDVNVVFLKRTMIVSSKSGVEVYLFTDVDDVKSYVRTASLPVPDVLIERNASELAGVQADEAATAEGLFGKFYANLNKLSENSGKLYGSFMYMVAYRLFDGSYIMPSIPRYVELSNGGNLKWRNPGGGSTEDRQFWLEFYGFNIKSSIDCSKYSGLEATKDLIESICIFMTKVTPLHQILNTSLSDLTLANVYGNKFNSEHNINTWPFETVFPVINSDFKELGKSVGWYKVHEFDFEKIVDTPYVLVEYPDTKGFYQDYATRETLTTDQFTHHILSAREAYVYNDRLHLANIKTSPGKPYVLWHYPDTFVQMTTTPGKVVVSLKTTLGKCTVVHDIDIPVYRKTEDMTNYLIIPEVVGYNDSRANRITITATIDGLNYQLLSDTLVKNETMNFAFWHKTTFSLAENVITSRTANYTTTEIKVSDITTYLSIPAPVDLGLPFDPNRVQVSEIQNPLIFPTKYSYQIGTGSILKLMAGSEPLSTGQFGQFPLQVFTTKGIWAMEIGLGDILYTNIIPVNGEVADNPKNIIPVGSGVVYSTVRGLFIVNGRQVVEISEGVENNFEELKVIDTPEVTELLTNVKYVPNLLNSLSRVGFLSYLSSSSIGYDHLNKELIVTNENYSYSYIYSFDSQMWYKISQSFKLLINSYPKLLGVTASNILSLSDESDANKVECFIMSAAQSLESPDAFKKIEQAVLRSKLSIEDGSNAVFCVFASDDLITWQLLIGRMKSGSNQVDMTVQRTHVTSKYYAFVFSGKISTDSEIKQLEIIFNVKWNNHLH